MYNRLIYYLILILVNTITAGQLLCGGLFSTDSLSNWFAAVALLHAVVDNPSQKEQLLRVQLATSIGNPPISLLQQCCNILAQVLNEWYVLYLFKNNLNNTPLKEFKLYSNKTKQIWWVFYWVYKEILNKKKRQDMRKSSYNIQI